MPHISIKPEIIAELFGYPITNSYLTSSIVIILFLFLSVYFKMQLESPKKGDFFYIMKYFINVIYNFFSSILGSKIDVFFSIIGAFFFFVLFQNWFGLLPGVGSILVGVREQGQMIKVPLFRGSSADLNTTLGLALVSFFLIQYYGIKYLGPIGYLKKFIILKNPILFASGILEIVSEFSKIISFSFRLFGNIFAGEVLLSIMAFLIPVLASFPFLIMELFFGMIQAMIFSVLTAVFINMAITKAEH